MVQILAHRPQGLGRIRARLCGPSRRSFTFSWLLLASPLAPQPTGMARKQFSVIRDPVHGDVYLSHEEMRLLDTPEMQRLRGIKQLGTTYLVFPGALHTRFDQCYNPVR